MFDRTHFDGVLVVDRAVPTVDHIAPGRAGEPGMRLTGVTELLLENGVVVYACDDCEKGFPKARSANAHRTSHNPTQQMPDTPLETIKTVIRLCRGLRREGVRGYAVLAAENLNQRNVPSASGKRWTRSMVSRIYSTYADRYPELRGPRRHTAAAPAGAVTADRSDRQSTVTTATTRPRARSLRTEDLPPDETGLLALGVRLTQRTEQLARDLAQLSRDLVDLVHRVADCASRDPEPVDPELVEKAKKWDQAQSLFGGSR